MDMLLQACRTTAPSGNASGGEATCSGLTFLCEEHAVNLNKFFETGETSRPVRLRASYRKSLEAYAAGGCTGPLGDNIAFLYEWIKFKHPEWVVQHKQQYFR